MRSLDQLPDLRLAVATKYFLKLTNQQAGFHRALT